MCRYFFVPDVEMSSLFANLRGRSCSPPSKPISLLMQNHGLPLETVARNPVVASGWFADKVRNAVAGDLGTGCLDLFGLPKDKRCGILRLS
jgi:hypothetical protein